ncbi:MAG: thermonuclease family protein [Candidatus Omnitrophica bacterium]|nr:thermonuclease family protein [Candidatus Omnitrophota bacterium]
MTSATLSLRRWRKTLIPLLAGAALAAVSLAASPRGSAQSRDAVERVVDGDTVKLVSGDRVRYIGVDTPELHHPKKGVEYYGREAKAFNRRMVEGKKIRLEYDVQKRDKYGRLLAYVYLEDGTFVNAELIRQGYAQILTIPPNVRHQEQFLRLEREARQDRRGLWAKQPPKESSR